MVWFLKQHGNMSFEEMYYLYPYEFEIFWYMAVNDFEAKEKERMKEIQRLEALAMSR